MSPDPSRRGHIHSVPIVGSDFGERALAQALDHQRFDERVEFAKKLAEGRATKACLEQFLFTCAAENPNRPLRLTALQDRVGMRVERADFDDLVTLVTSAPTWE